jgi:hypothetical protein
MNKRIILAALVFGVLFSCSYDTVEDNNENSGVVIKTGMVCGWCSRNDTLTIRENSVRYVNYANCSTVNPTIQKTGQITTSDLTTLLADLDFAELKKLDLNSCNVCVDGCDSWLLVDYGSESHYIRFGGTESELQPIQAFLDQLNLIKAQYSGETQ